MPHTFTIQRAQSGGTLVTKANAPGPAARAQDLSARAGVPAWVLLGVVDKLHAGWPSCGCFKARH
jgi:hypothetical protein